LLQVVSEKEADRLISCSLGNIALDIPGCFEPGTELRVEAAQLGMHGLTCFTEHQRGALLHPLIWGPRFLLLRTVRSILADLGIAEVDAERILCEVSKLWDVWAGWVSDEDAPSCRLGDDDDHDRLTDDEIAWAVYAGDW